MIPRFLPSSRTNATRRAVLELVLCGIAFEGAAFIAAWSSSPFTEMVWPALFIGAAFWWGVQWATPDAQATLRPLSVGAGLALMAEALCAYTDWEPLTLANFLIGCVGAAMLVLAARRVLDAEKKSARVVPLVLDGEQSARPRFLLECKLAGIDLETDRIHEERRLRRVPPESVGWADLLCSDTLREARPVMAVQAIYSNLIGLALVVGLSPLLLLVGAAARVSAGSGPFFERIECAGFQGVPFFRRAFRVRHAATGESTVFGKLLTRLRLAGLPQLINLVRGEMTLFGPQPVRLAFAEYLDRLSPVFSRRLLVKPGIFGWAQAHGGGAGATRRGFASRIQEERLRIAYDLYYLEFGSPWMDLEILGRTLLRPVLASRSE